MNSRKYISVFNLLVDNKVMAEATPQFFLFSYAPKHPQTFSQLTVCLFLKRSTILEVFAAVKILKAMLE